MRPRGILLPAWTSGDPERIRPAIEEFVAEFRNSELLPKQYLRQGVAVMDVIEWLFEVEHVRLSYGLKYKGVELEKLSPGTKGIVLLILYLGMDVADTRPLIVDQPDENLDNESIYALLTTYFRTAKRRRQVILITHNPNLVVNADSEQVIVATAERRADGPPAHRVPVRGPGKQRAAGTGHPAKGVPDPGRRFGRLPKAGAALCAAGGRCLTWPDPHGSTRRSPGTCPCCATGERGRISSSWRAVRRTATSSAGKSRRSPPRIPAPSWSALRTTGRLQDSMKQGLKKAAIACAAGSQACAPAMSDPPSRPCSGLPGKARQSCWPSRFRAGRSRSTTAGTRRMSGTFPVRGRPSRTRSSNWSANSLPGTRLHRTRTKRAAVSCPLLRQR